MQRNVDMYGRRNALTWKMFIFSYYRIIISQNHGRNISFIQKFPLHFLLLYACIMHHAVSAWQVHQHNNCTYKTIKKIETLFQFLSAKTATTTTIHTIIITKTNSKLTRLTTSSSPRHYHRHTTTTTDT